MKKILIIGGSGYIGSKLFDFLKIKYSVDTIDLEWFGKSLNPKNIKKDYKNLSKDFLKKYNVIILLAGHSTVKMCSNKMLESFENNVGNFISLLNKIKNQKLIYTSSYRVYGSGLHMFSEDSSLPVQTTYYDLTKSIIDSYATQSNINYFGLRMATVNGFSPKLRINQVINKLFIQALRDRKIEIINPSLKFSVLGIDDLCRAIDTIISTKANKGIYNLASFSCSIEMIGKEIKKTFSDIKVTTKKNNKKPLGTRVSTKKFEKEFGFKFKDNLPGLINSLSDNFSKIKYEIKDK
jgi:nucleoside-diphosphate-sugar epimerase